MTREGSRWFTTPCVQLKVEGKKKIENWSNHRRQTQGWKEIIFRNKNCLDQLFHIDSTWFARLVASMAWVSLNIYCLLNKYLGIIKHAIFMVACDILFSHREKSETVRVRHILRVRLRGCLRMRVHAKNTPSSTLRPKGLTNVFPRVKISF